MSLRVLIAAIVAVGLFFAPGAATAEPGNGQSGKADSPPGQSQQQGQAGEHGKPAAQDTNEPQPPSNADFTDHGANQHGPYDSTRDGSPSENGNGDGQQIGQPCAGCVGKADNKNPPGQLPGGSDANAGYECDRNSGVGRGNPAHTGCTETDPTSTTVPVSTTTSTTEPTSTSSTSDTSSSAGTDTVVNQSPGGAAGQPNPVATGLDEALAHTGSNPLWLLLMGLLTLAVGTLVLLTARRRRA